MNVLESQFLIFLLTVVTAISGCTTAKSAGDKKSFLIQMTDPQFGMFTNNNGFSEETKNFNLAIKDANQLHPAFVIVCGDLVNETNNPFQIAEYKRIAAQLEPSIPFYQVAGNHDLRNEPSPQSLANYRKKFGPDYYSFTSANLFAIVLNSSLFKDPTLVKNEAEKQEAWLKKTLKKAKEKKFANIVIFQHIPFFLTTADEKDGYFNIPMEQRMKYLDLLNKYGVKYVFAGHLHRNSIGKYKGIEMVATGPIGKPLGKDPSGFRIVTVNKNNISHRYYALDSVPSLP